MHTDTNELEILNKRVRLAAAWPFWVGLGIITIYTLSLLLSLFASSFDDKYSHGIELLYLSIIMYLVSGLSLYWGRLVLTHNDKRMRRLYFLMALYAIMLAIAQFHPISLLYLFMAILLIRGVLAEQKIIRLRRIFSKHRQQGAYVYLARTRDGLKKSGIVSAATKQQAVQLIERQGLFPVSVDLLDAAEFGQNVLSTPSSIQRNSSSLVVTSTDLHTDSEILALCFGFVILGIVLVFITTISVGLLTIALVAVTVLMVWIQQNQLLGQSALVSSTQFPEIFSLAVESAMRLNMQQPEVFLRQDPTLNAYAIGFLRKKSVILHSATVEAMTPTELEYIIGHEFTHIKCGHTNLKVITSSHEAIRIPLISHFMKFVFLFWGRKAEYTSDRGGILCCRDINAAISAMCKLAVGPALYQKMDVSHFMNQQIATQHSMAKLSEAFSTHPYLVKRIAAGKDFFQSDYYQALLRITSTNKNRTCNETETSAFRFKSPTAPVTKEINESNSDSMPLVVASENQTDNSETAQGIKPQMLHGQNALNTLILECARCGSKLKVGGMLTRKYLLCPKCHSQVPVPRTHHPPLIHREILRNGDDKRKAERLPVLGIILGLIPAILIIGLPLWLLDVLFSWLERINLFTINLPDFLTTFFGIAIGCVFFIVWFILAYWIDEKLTGIDRLSNISDEP